MRVHEHFEEILGKNLPCFYCFAALQAVPKFAPCKFFVQYTHRD